MHCVTAVSLYCVCLLKCGVKWILISQHRLTVYNQLCARVASPASQHFQIARNSAQNSFSMHTCQAHCSYSERGNRSEQYYTHPNKIIILNRGRVAEYFFLSCVLSVAKKGHHCQTPYYRILHHHVYQSNYPTAVVIFSFPIPDFCLFARQVERRKHACSSIIISSVTQRSNILFTCSRNEYVFLIHRCTNADISPYLLKYGYLEQETALFPHVCHH